MHNLIWLIDRICFPQFTSFLVNFSQNCKLSQPPFLRKICLPFVIVHQSQYYGSRFFDNYKVDPHKRNTIGMLVSFLCTECLHKNPAEQALCILHQLFGTKSFDLKMIILSSKSQIELLKNYCPLPVLLNYGISQNDPNDPKRAITTQNEPKRPKTSHNDPKTSQNNPKQPKYDQN